MFKNSIHTLIHALQLRREEQTQLYCLAGSEDREQRKLLL